MRIKNRFLKVKQFKKTVLNDSRRAKNNSIGNHFIKHLKQFEKQFKFEEISFKNKYMNRQKASKQLFQASSKTSFKGPLKKTD